MNMQSNGTREEAVGPSGFGASDETAWWAAAMAAALAAVLATVGARQVVTASKAAAAGARSREGGGGVEDAARKFVRRRARVLEAKEALRVEKGGGGERADLLLGRLKVSSADGLGWRAEALEGSLGGVC